MHRLLLLLALVLATISPAAARNPDSAFGTLANLPANYRDGVVWLSADNADPQPDRWYVTARNSARRGLLMNLTIENGRITSERPAISPRAFLRQITSINVRSLRVNSTDLWRDARKRADQRGRRLGTISLQLEQHGRDAKPVWSVWSYDRRGGYIGYFSVLATTGAVISSR